MKIIQIAIIVIIIISIMMIFSAIIFYNIHTEKKIVKCYDRAHNEIIGLECYEESVVFEGMGVILFYGGIFLIFLSLIALILSDF